MLAPQALMRLIVSRVLPSANVDSANTDVSLRGARYGELFSVPLVNKAHTLADEGSYFTTNNAQTAITSTAAIAFAATTPALILVNNDAAGGKRMYPDYIYLQNGATAFSNATSNTAMYFAAVLDTGNRFSSGGTALTANIVSANMDITTARSVALAYFGAPTATAASGSARTLVGQRVFREPVSATALTLANLDDWYFNFGGIDNFPGNATGSSGAVQANIVHKVIALPPVVIGPGQSFLLYLWQISNSSPVAGTLVPEIGWWER